MAMACLRIFANSRAGMSMDVRWNKILSWDLLHVSVLLVIQVFACIFLENRHHSQWSALSFAN